MNRLIELLTGKIKAAGPEQPGTKSPTASQKAILSAIRQYEERARPRLTKKGDFSRVYREREARHTLTPADEGAPSVSRTAREGRKLLIPMVVPLHLSQAHADELRRVPKRRIVVAPTTDKLAYEVMLQKEDGTRSPIARTPAKPPLTRPEAGGKSIPPGLVLAGSDKQPTLALSVPRSQTSLTGKATRNQGEVLRQLSRAVATGRGVHQPTDLQSGFDAMLSGLPPTTASNVLQLGGRRIEDVAWHDFSDYEYLREPELLPLAGLPRLSKAVLDFLDSLDDGSIEVSEVLGFVGKLNVTIRSGAELVAIERNADWNQSDLVRVCDAYEAAAIESGVLSQLYETYFLNYGAQSSTLFPDWWATGLRLESLNMSVVADSGWTAGDPVPLELLGEWVRLMPSIQYHYPPDINPATVFDPTGLIISQVSSEIAKKLDYPFDLLKAHSWNLGLRLVYRQEWRPLGIQRGEVIRTVPLGPKQTEKVSTKITRRQKVARTAESLKAVETTTETSDTTKDSGETVQEASETYKWNWDAEGGFSVAGVGSAKASGGESGGWDDKSRSTSTHLTEAVQKTANKLRRENKVVVSTESESAFEVTTASEIQNPNDEIAVTYVYSKLQRQYEILTRLAEVHGVVFIAEPVPLLYEVTREWVRKHDWIVAKVLLDDSFREALTSVSQDLPQDSLPRGVTQRIAGALDESDKFLEALAAKNTSLSLTSVDLSQEAQRAYRETQKEELERRRTRNLLSEKQERLLQHIRDNILHYCRAIWSAEDPDQKMLRYRKCGIRIPTVWQFVLDGGGAISGWSVSGLPPTLRGHFEPDLTDPETVRLAVDLVRPDGPIGYVGNYAIYYLKSDAEIDPERIDTIFDMLQLMRSAFMDPARPGELVDPALQAMKRPDSPSYVKVPDSISAGEARDMVDYVPELRAQYETLDEQDRKRFVTYLQRLKGVTLADDYYEYKFRKDNSRRLVLDTNNLIVDLEVGHGSALETFKQLHRYIDVLKASEEKDKMRLENRRRDSLLKAHKYGDPDIEKVVVVSGKSVQLGSLVAGT